METETIPNDVSRRWIPYAALAIVATVATVWLSQSLLPPHTATARMRLDLDTSTGSVWPNARWPSPGWENVVANLRSPAVAQRAAVLLEPIAPEEIRDGGYILSRASVQTDRDGSGLEVRFSTESRELARLGADAVVAAIGDVLETQPKPGPRWVVASSTDAVTTSNIDWLVIVLYILGAGGLLATIPRSWWFDQVPMVGSTAAASGLLAAGVGGALVFGAADVAGYGYSGLGTVQLVGLAAMLATALVGLSELVRRRNAVY